MNASCASRASQSVCFRVNETAQGISVTYGIVSCIWKLSRVFSL